LVVRGAAYLARALQFAQQDVLGQDWIRAARARGLGGLVLWRRHVLPALRLPLVGMLLGMLRVMIGSIVIVDYIYGWGGLGQRMLNFRPFAVASADTSVSITAALSLVVLFVVVDAIGQLGLRYADPRLRDLNE
jgi:peptide/nickel transport system permease protein